MKLYFETSNFPWAPERYHYSAEQMMLTLFPEERPEYPEGSRDMSGEKNAAVFTLHRGKKLTNLSVLVFRPQGYYNGVARFPSEELDRSPEEVYHTVQHALKLAFYKAGTALLGREPPWGALTGVRPVKLPPRAILAGASPKQAQRELEKDYHVSPQRARLAVDCARASVEVRQSLEPGEVSLYVGIPFCPTRCAYCSFVSADVGRTLRLVEPYLEGLLREVAETGRLLRELGLRVRSFYMGGGTPTTLTADQLDRVLGAFQASFDTSACGEITVEAGRPDTITAEKLAVLKARGVTRVSVNPQTMEERVLRAIGRNHTPGDIDRALALTDKYGFPHVNMDLIAGLPEDTPEGFQRSLDACLAYGTGNVTVHTLALKKGSRLLTERFSVPAPEAVEEMLNYAGPALRAAGHRPYYLYRQKYMSGSFENIGWCRPGAECLYNVYIMSELCSILSFGAGGSTKMVQPGTNRIQRTFNAKYPKEYTERPEKCLGNQQMFAAFYEDLFHA